MFVHRLVGIIMIVLTMSACNQVEETIPQKLTIGVISYGESSRSLEKYAALQNYLSTQLKSIIELEPAYNEIKALEQISQQKWDLVFADSGLAAIAIHRHQYVPLIPLEGIETVKSIIVVNSQTKFQENKDLLGEIIALGQEGSATGYYLPIYNLYGLVFAEVRFAPTPQTSLQWLDQEQVAAAALSLKEFNRYKKDFPPNQFRIIDVDSHLIPAGAVLATDKISVEQQQQIQSYLAQTPSHIAASAGFLPNEQFPEYDNLIKVIERVIPIAEGIKEQPAFFYERNNQLNQKENNGARK